MLCIQLIFWLGVAASVSIGLGNAGNDLCNAMGVTVGARVLPLWKAVVLGALFDGLGALLMGGRVAHTVGERIVDPALYSDEPLLLAKAMLVVMLAGGATMITGTLAAMPISASSKGMYPPSRMKMSTPALHMSTSTPYVRLKRISGAT